MVFANVRGGLILTFLTLRTMSISPAPKRLAFFERYLTVWVLVCMVVGVAFGKLLPGRHVHVEQAGVRARVTGERADWHSAVADDLSDDAQGGFQRHRRHRQAAKGLMVTLFVNWLVKPFSMALPRVALHAACFCALD